MFKRFTVMLLLIISASVLVMPARAAGSPWTAWLYENDTGRLTQVNDSGTTLLQIQLQADAGSRYSQNVAISQDGALIAYAASNDSATVVSVYNLNSNTVVYTYTLPGTNTTTSLDFSANAFNFSEGSATFAFGYATTNVGWQIAVVDLKNFSAVTLKEGNPAVVGFPPSNGYFLPDVMSNRNQNIAFIMIPLGTDGRPRYDGYIWNITTNSVNPTDLYLTPDNDTLPQTGEMITTLSDERFPNSSDATTGFPVNNTLHVFQPESGERSVVTAFTGMYYARFIQGGERVGFIQYQTTGAGETLQVLYVLERSGAIAGPVQGVPAANITSLAGILNGFLFTQGGGGKENGTTLYYVETRAAGSAFSGVPVWSSAVGVNARLVWASDSGPAGDGSFAAWGQIQPPSVQPTLVPQVPVGDSAYAVGVTAQVQTTDNDVLNIRSGPGVNYSRLGTINNGTMVTLIEGPQTADGFTWWRVRLPTGVEGWVVIQVDGINTLLPR